MSGRWHRLGQGVHALLAFAQKPDLALARAQLSACEYRAFIALSRADQLHSLRVLNAILSADSGAPPALRAAALLHDIGKARHPLSVWQKTLAVVTQNIAPRLSRRLSRGRRLSWWRAPFIAQARHAAWGSAILRECGSQEQVIWLVEQHQTEASAHAGHPWQGLLRRLQAADRV